MSVTGREIANSSSKMPPYLGPIKFPYKLNDAEPRCRRRALVLQVVNGRRMMLKTPFKALLVGSQIAVTSLMATTAIAQTTQIENPSGFHGDCSRQRAGG